MYVFVNELSFQAQATSIVGANRLIKDLISVITSVKPLQNSDPVCASMTLWEKEISSGLSINQFLGQIHRDQALLLKILLRHGPYSEVLIDTELSYHECWLDQQDVSSSSLAAATFYDGILVSLQGSNEFDVDLVHLTYREEEEEYQNVEITNFYDAINVTLKVENIVGDILKDISSWDQLWEQKGTYFPKLMFCDCVEQQLNKLDCTPVNMKIVREHLIKIDDYRELLDRDNIVPDYKKMGVVASQETPITLHHYGYLREFVCPDGEQRLFDWHTKQLGTNARIHFYPKYSGSNTILIGYIGPHLKTYLYH